MLTFVYWDSDMATLFLLTHLLPPPPGGKRAVKISAADAADRLVVHHKSCNSIEEHLRQKEERQPYLLAVGQSRGQIDSYYIVLDKKLIPCQAIDVGKTRESPRVKELRAKLLNI
ncbi:hypothetical protein AMEX_G8359 [Astyanax mexicanus]|uniref:Uncharacterized protein n=1 Tax=Astyanax mexicanus TaxID=7994 RepID=A0A8T2M240_ASTMX|nr:hypothetical protein AMEX_G8359 [Astyanax mexicanus]